MAARTVPEVPTVQMLDAARDWSYKKYDKPIGTEAAIGCWNAMLSAAPAEPDPAADPEMVEKFKEAGTRSELVNDLEYLDLFIHDHRLHSVTLKTAIPKVVQLERDLAALEEKLKLSEAVADCLGRQVQIKDDDRIFFRDKLAAVEAERDALAKAFGAVSETAKIVSGRDAT